jgi:hypothetical protein
MPVAVLTGDEDERLDLKTLPDAFVIVKLMDHGQKLRRQDMNSKMKFNMSGRKRDVQAEIDMLQKQVTIWEWATLITDHNLLDLDGRPLDFKREADVLKVRGKVAEEISTFISKVNNFEEDAEDEESPLAAS